MPRPDKVAAVEELRDAFESAPAVFVTEYRGLSVSAMQELRGKLRDAGAEYKVTKMTLAKIAASELGHDDLADHLTGPSGLVFSGADSVEAAKAVSEFAKTNPDLVIKAGLLGSSLMDAAGVEALTKVEPREVQLAKIAGALKAPLSKTAALLDAPISQTHRLTGALLRDAASVFNQLQTKKAA